MKNIRTCLCIFFCTIFFVQVQAHQSESIFSERSSLVLYLPLVNQIEDPLTFSNVKAPAEVRKFQRFEVNFQLEGLSHQNRQLPYLSAADSNRFIEQFVDEGVTIDGIFTDPLGNEFQQPAFWFEQHDDQLSPNGQTGWQIRFSPHLVGTWRFRLEAESRDGTGQSETFTFEVIDSAEPGFIQPSKNDPRYFEFDNGDYYSNIGFNYSIHGLNDNHLMENLSANGINYVRAWITRLNITGGAWSHLSMKPTVYDGYLPRGAVVPYTPLGQSERELWWRVAQNNDWYRSCLYTNQEHERIQVKPNTDYLVQTEFESYGVTPADASRPHGFTVMIDGWVDHCDELKPASAITTHPSKLGEQNEQKITAEGVWHSGEHTSIPFVYLALDNASAGDVYIKSVSIRERLPSGQLGPELFVEPTADKRTYYTQRESAILDQIITKAEKHVLYLRLVISEKEDPLFLRTGPDGSFTETAAGNFYGDGRTVQANRYLQMAWWRYLQARWGYSTAVHSWELINEGDPFNHHHYALADEFGKYMKCTVFGIEATTRCDDDHPNAHMVSTSFWHSFPSDEFWRNAAYPNIDFADVHRYLPATKSRTHQDLTKAVLDLSQAIGAESEVAPDKPVIRGETGLVRQDTSGAVDGLRKGQNPVWLHNMLWSSLNNGGVIESGYWYVKEHIVNKDFSLLNHYARFAGFVNQIPLNNGKYGSLEAKFSDVDFPLVGQFDRENQRAHGWLRNADFNWHAVENGQSEFGLDGDLTIGGMAPQQTYQISLITFGLAGGYQESSQIIQAAENGSLKIPIVSADDVGSVAFSIKPMLKSETTQPAVAASSESGRHVASMGIECLPDS